MKKLSNITESIWNDIRRRGIGTDVKQEEHIDFLDRKDLVDYLKAHYVFDPHQPIIQTNGLDDSITVCLYEDEDGYYVYLSYIYIDGDSEIHVLGSFKETIEEAYNELKTKYTVTENPENYDEDGHPYSYIRVEPKGCRYTKLTNSFFIEILDFIIDRIKEPFIKEIEKK